MTSQELKALDTTGWTPDQLRVLEWAKKHVAWAEHEVRHREEDMTTFRCGVDDPTVPGALERAYQMLDQYQGDVDRAFEPDPEPVEPTPDPVDPDPSENPEDPENPGDPENPATDPENQEG